MKKLEIGKWYEVTNRGQLIATKDYENVEVGDWVKVIYNDNDSIRESEEFKRNSCRNLLYEGSVMALKKDGEAVLFANGKDLELVDLEDEKVLFPEVGKWYISDRGLFRYQGRKPYTTAPSSYGFDAKGNWVDNYAVPLVVFREADQAAVEKALEAEAEKRYGKDWKDMKVKECLSLGNDERVNNGKFIHGVSSSGTLWIRNGCIFNDGKWAEAVKDEVIDISLKKAKKIIAKKYGMADWKNVKIQGI